MNDLLVVNEVNALNDLPHKQLTFILCQVILLGGESLKEVSTREVFCDQDGVEGGMEHFNVFNNLTAAFQVDKNLNLTQDQILSSFS